MKEALFKSFSLQLLSYRSPAPGYSTDEQLEECSENPKRPLSFKQSVAWSSSEDNLLGLVQPRPPQKPRAASARTRVKSANSKLTEKRQSMALSAKLASSGRPVTNRTNDALDAGLIEWEHTALHPTPHMRRAPSAEGRAGGVNSANSRYTPVNMFLCPGCDKMYTTQKDLDIHKSFCYGRI